MRKHSDLSPAERKTRVSYYHLFRSQGQTTEQAWIGALRHMHFVKTLREDLAASAKRSKAAKKAWKVRKAVMA